MVNGKEKTWTLIEARRRYISAEEMIMVLWVGNFEVWDIASAGS